MFDYKQTFSYNISLKVYFLNLVYQKEIINKLITLYFYINNFNLKSNSVLSSHNWTNSNVFLLREWQHNLFSLHSEWAINEIWMEQLFYYFSTFLLRIQNYKCWYKKFSQETLFRFNILQYEQDKKERYRILRNTLCTLKTK